MDRHPQDNNYTPQYHWLSPLRDIQPGIFNLEPASNPEDNPMHGINPKLFAERATNTSARAGPSTHTGYQPCYHWLKPPRNIQPGICNQEPASNPEDNPISGVDPALSTERATNTSASAGPSTHSSYQPHYHWLNPPRDIQPGTFNPEPTSNSEDNPISGVDPALSTERAIYSSARAGPSTHSGYQHQGVQTQNQSFSWPTTSITGMNLTLTKTSLDTDTRWPAYQGQNTQNLEIT